MTVKMNKPNIASVAPNMVNPTHQREDGAPHLGVQRKGSTPDLSGYGGSEADYGYGFDVASGGHTGQERQDQGDQLELPESRQEAFDAGRTSQVDGRKFGEHEPSQGPSLDIAERDFVPSSASINSSAELATAIEAL